mmetsp:Transcript_3645/g.8122  ORF Transcript_3645/g.8122 Transcript_3645/m.8122 type:complete len:251 (+) Transcript_3645:166-918(+)
MDVLLDFYSVFLNAGGVWDCLNHHFEKLIRNSARVGVGDTMSNDNKVSTILGATRVFVQFDGPLFDRLIEFKNHKVVRNGETRVIVERMLDCTCDGAQDPIARMGAVRSNDNIVGNEEPHVAVSSGKHEVIMNEASSASHPTDEEGIFVRLRGMTPNDLCGELGPRASLSHNVWVAHVVRAAPEPVGTGMESLQHSWVLVVFGGYLGSNCVGVSDNQVIAFGQQRFFLVFLQNLVMLAMKTGIIHRQRNK